MRALECTFALNHMAYFVVTDGLRETLLASAPAIFGEPAASENRTCVVDRDVNARFLAGDFGGDALHLRDACQIGVMDCVCEVTRSFVKPRESYSSACFAPRNQNDPGAHLRKPLRGNLANS
jgi:hypothetical protein